MTVTPDTLRVSYANGTSLRALAREYGLPRERVRQIVLGEPTRVPGPPKASTRRLPKMRSV